MKIALEISYLGTNYCGWQKQKNEISIAEIIEKAYKEKFKEDITLFASGRTDAGVHAYSQIAHFETFKNVKAEKIAIALNTVLPADIRIIKSFEVDTNFHARFSAKKKTYEYLAYTADVDNVFLVNRALRIASNINIEKMQKASKLLIGEHDFTSFCKQKSSEKDCKREIYDIKISQNSNGLISFLITGNGFLHNMIRIIVSALIEVGKRKLSEDDLTKILNAKDRTKAPRTAPSYALYLKSVEY